jgi:hypothetical protein
VCVRTYRGTTLTSWGHAVDCTYCAIACRTILLMPTCFVIQPFDSGQYDKRYEQVFKPAIIAAGLEPYRVDQDVRVDVPIDAIESGIRDASVCLAEISTDNPNVWYELGYAFAVGKPVVMVCSTVRSKYPFDIQHRTVTSYKAEAPEDFVKLQHQITARLGAAITKSEALREIAEADPVASVAGLSHTELIVLAVLASEVGAPDGMASIFSVQSDSERNGLTKLGFTLALRRLQTKKFVHQGMDSDFNGNEYLAIGVTEQGWSWIDTNESRFILQRPARKEPDVVSDLTDDDIPF